MNFPDLETCRAIGAEFPDSEYVWIRHRNTGKTVSFPVNLKKHTEHPEFYEVIARAPTCEELGEWLLGKLDSFISKHAGGFLENLIIKSWCHVEKSETQARAESVKLIMENQQ